MKCPFRKFSLEYDHFVSGEKHHHEEYEECYKDDCPFYAKTEKRELCTRAKLEVIENNVKNYTI